MEQAREKDPAARINWTVAFDEELLARSQVWLDGPTDEASEYALALIDQYDEEKYYEYLAQVDEYDSEETRAEFRCWVIGSKIHDPDEEDSRVAWKEGKEERDAYLEDLYMAQLGDDAWLV